MDSSRWERIQTLFHEAAVLPPAEQRAFLKTACGEDEGLIADVLSLLHEDATATSLLDQPLAEVAHDVLDEGASSLPFQELGPYRIRKVLGEGGMGVVYLGEREDLGSLVALKLLRDAWLSPARRERFAAEQRTLAQLNHPSIARLYDADTLPDGTPFFVMEYVEGLPLTEYCVQHQCSIERRLQLFRQVCEVVQYAHSNTVIHRDLKPSNILVKSDGTIRLLDFGIAKQLESLDVPATQTMTALRMMTPAYAAPEQIRGQRVGVQSDVYSLGMILYELLCGQLPFDLSNLAPAEAETVLLEHEPPKPSAVVERTERSSYATPNLDAASWADLDVLCLTAMHKDRERRYRSVEAVIRDVDHYLQAEPLEARPDTLGYRLSKFVRRNRNEVLTAAAVLAVVIGLVVFFTVRLARARDAALAEAARTQRIQRFMTNVFQGGDEAAGPAASVKVVDMIDRGVREAQALSSDPKVQAELLYNFGGIYQQLGQLDKADSLFKSALAKRQSLFGADSAEVAETLVALGLLRFDQSRLEEAEQLTRQGLEMSQRHLPPDHPVVAKAAIAVGRVLGERGAHDEAIRVLEEEVRRQSASGASSTEVVNSLSELAAAQYRAGHYEASDPLYRRVLEMHQQLYGTRHPLVAEDLESLASIHIDLGYYSKAEQFARQALDITDAYYGKDNPKVATDLTSLGQALAYQNKFDESVAVLDRALAIKEHAFGPVHSSVADTLNELGNVEYMRDQWDEAEAHFRRVVDIYRAVYGDHHFKVAIALSNVASTYLDRKDYPRAEQMYRDVVRRNTEALSADNVNTGIARVKLGRTLVRQNRYAEAEVESLAGYNILIKQTSPETTFIRAARKDLIAAYEGMKQPEKAAKYRSELAAAEAKPTDTTRKN